MAKRKKTYPVEELSKESQELFDVLNSEDDLSAVLIAASFLDTSLASMLSQYFLESTVSDNLLDPNRGAIGTFSARIDVAYILGLINKDVYQDLVTIAEIRNLFAHNHLAIDFQNPEITNKCFSLKYLDVLDSIPPGTRLRDPRLSFSGYAKTPRDKFSNTIVMISQQLLVKALGIKHREPYFGFLPDHLKPQ